MTVSSSLIRKKSIGKCAEETHMRFGG
jgi:hypothetical protein